MLCNDEVTLLSDRNASRAIKGHNVCTTNMSLRLIRKVCVTLIGLSVSGYWVLLQVPLNRTYLMYYSLFVLEMSFDL